MKEFKELNLKPELLDALRGMGFNNMTEVQELSIPALMEHKDLVVRSKTGSGKTGAFLVPIFQALTHQGHPQAIVIVPTRELAVQVNSVAHKLSRGSRLRTTVVYGGASINVQMQSLREGADIIVGTPGRILDLMERGALFLDRIKFLVLDEADLMLDMGFIDDIERIILESPRTRQTMLFSATMPRDILTIARKYMKEGMVKLTVGEEEKPTVETISHSYFVASGKMKFAALMAYIEKFKPSKCIIFTSTQRESEYVHRVLTLNGMDALIMHGGLTQAVRERSLRDFREHSRFLISTNLASRGLDIPDVSDIINFDAPDDPRIYVHRVGRSARMGKNGRAFTIYGFDQESLMSATKKAANIEMKHLELDTERFKNIQLPPMRSGRSGYGRESGFRRQFNNGRRQFGEGGRGRGVGGGFGGGGGGGANRHDYGGRRRR